MGNKSEAPQTTVEQGWHHRQLTTKLLTCPTFSTSRSLVHIIADYAATPAIDFATTHSVSTFSLPVPSLDNVDVGCGARSAVLFCVGDEVRCFDTNDGTVNRLYKHPNASRLTQPRALQNDKLIVATRNRSFILVDDLVRGTAHELRYETEWTKFIRGDEGHIFLVHAYGLWYAVDGKFVRLLEFEKKMDLAHDMAVVKDDGDVWNFYFSVDDHIYHASWTGSLQDCASAKSTPTVRLTCIYKGIGKIWRVHRHGPFLYVWRLQDLGSWVTWHVTTLARVTADNLLRLAETGLTGCTALAASRMDEEQGSVQAVCAKESGRVELHHWTGQMAKASSTEMKERKKDRGRLIVFEGLDRAGKTTQANLLMEHFMERLPTSHRPLFLRFPDRSTVIGKTIDAYLRGKQMLDAHALHHLFVANRHERAVEIRECLAAGRHVIVDRYSASGMAYSVARGLNVRACLASEYGLPEPDLILFLDAPCEVLAQRHGYGKEVDEKTDFQAKVASAYATVRQYFCPTSWQTIDARHDQDTVHGLVLEYVARMVTTVEKSE